VKINEYGQVTYTDNELFKLLYSGNEFDLNHITLEDQKKIDQFNNARKINADTFCGLNFPTSLNIDIDLFDKQNQSNWFFPTDYCPDLIALLFDMCETQEEKDRVALELELFVQHNMINLLYYLKYLIDTMRNNNITWGVGRGSSVSSYVLYLLGVHKVDSLKYKLDIKEFIK
jgi:hypothetical protein